MYNPELDYACFTPPFSIMVDIRRLKRDYSDNWIIQSIALLAHELAHLYEYHFIYKCNAELWNSAEYPEVLADKIQDYIFNKLSSLYTSRPYQN